ncbi:MAG: hypothetical protein QM680_14000 [Luteolibacter sp.]
MTVSTWLTDAEKDRLEAIFDAGSARVETADEHWIHGWDEGQSFCRECAEKKIEELLAEKPEADICLDGGWGIEGDSLEFCETCSRRLWNSLTQYGCESEVDHFEDNGFDPADDDDCYSMERVVSSEGWGPYEDLPGSPYEKEQRHEYYTRLHNLGRRILANLDKSNPETTAGR